MGGGEPHDVNMPRNEPQTVVVAPLGNLRGGAPGRPSLGGSGREEPDDHGDDEQEEMSGGHDAPGYQAA